MDPNKPRVIKRHETRGTRVYFDAYTFKSYDGTVYRVVDVYDYNLGYLRTRAEIVK